MKTSELIGPALDWAVAKCEGRGLVCLKDDPHPLSALNSMSVYDPLCEEYLDYSTDWAQGGPIIEWERVSISYDSNHHPHLWWATKYNENEEPIDAHGPTPLIAAMRCYCASKLGDEVKIPEELE